MVKLPLNTKQKTNLQDYSKYLFTLGYCNLSSGFMLRLRFVLDRVLKHVVFSP